MQRSSPLYGVPILSGPSVTALPLLAPLSNVDQQQQYYGVISNDSMAHQPSPPGGRGSLKRKLPNSELDSRYSVPVTVAPYSPITDDADSGPLKAKPRKESVSSSSACSVGVELHEFPAFGQAFQGVSGIGQFYVIGPNDTNNNAANALTLGDAQQHHLHQEQEHHQQDHQQLATYIYDVPVTDTGVDGSQVVPITEHHLVSTVPSSVVSDVVHQTNGIVLTDISSSTWTSTAELLDLDRKSGAPTVPTNVHHHRYSIISTEHHHHHHQQQHPQHQQNHHQNHQQHHQHQQQQHHHHHQHQQQHLQQSAQQQHHTHHQHHQQQHQHTQLAHHLPHQSHQLALHSQSVQQLHTHHQPQQQPASCPSSPRPPAPPATPAPTSTTAVSSPSHVVGHHNNQQASQQHVSQYGGDAASPYGTGNNQSSSGGWTNPADACPTSQDDSSPHMEPTPSNLGVGTIINASQTPDTPEDCKNLSWLLNFKLDDIPNLSPRSNRKQRSKAIAAGNGPNATDGPGGGGNGSVGADHGALAIEEGDLNVGENVTIESSSGKSPKKPPFTYTELIEYALEEQGDLTVAAIYQWISDHFPYYKSHDDRWKNSVRHNLSINPHFRKGRKSSHGSGHLWTISSRNSEDNFLAWEHKKQRFEWFFKMEANARVREIGTTDSMTDDEVAAATASLAQYVPKSPASGSPVRQNLEAINPVASEQNHHLPSQTLQQHQQQQQQQPNHQLQHPQQHPHHQPQQQISAQYHQAQTLYADIITSAQFEVTAPAEEIKQPEQDTLNGLRRGTEIQIVRPAQTIQTYEMLDTEYNIADYLNPVPKEEIVQECGLRSVALDPAELGINIPSATSQDEDILFDDFNLNYFGNNIMT